jgi:squalene-hopene/tetraprenyl-beta-curcumene cyclase
MHVDEADARRRWAIGACERARRWVLAMQNKDGGWGAFDKDNDAEFLCRVPFADHNAMIDPATVDVSSRAVMALLLTGRSPRHPAVARGLAFIRRQQEEDGAWFGRWGCNYIYGTWLALCALRLAGETAEAATIGRAVGWLEAHQNDDGGWGELPHSYVDPATRGHGPSTACQTGWALLGLMAGGAHDAPSVERGVDYLLRCQEEEGGWRDCHWTGTGFPGVFYLHYHLYATYYPLMALAAFRRLAAGEDVFVLPAREAESTGTRGA